MRHQRVAIVVAGALGAAVGVMPALAAGRGAPGTPPSSASFTAHDFAWQATGGTTNQVTISQGGTVSFSYPSGASEHNADFTGGPAPTSCTQTAGASSGAVPPVPHSPTSPGWAGKCTFATVGTYTFHCDLHPFMTGTIVVQGSGTTTTSTTTTVPTTTTTTTTVPTTTVTTNPSTTAPTTTTMPTPTPRPRLTPHDIRLARHQRGRFLRGSLELPAGEAASVTVVVLGYPQSFGLPRTHRPVRLGRMTFPVRWGGRVVFAVRLNGLELRELRHRHRLAVTVVVTLRVPGEAAVTAERGVVLRAP